MTGAEFQDVMVTATGIGLLLLTCVVVLMFRSEP